MHRLGIDFGTSNTAAAVMAGDKPYLIPVEPGQTTLPTSLFFDMDRKVTLYGNAANAALIDGREGRFMRALKSVLGTPLMRERRQIGYDKLTLIEAVARFLSTIKTRAEDATGLRFEAALSGRPVQFHHNAERNAQAEIDLREAYMVAGFKDVAFMYEPEAAAQTAAQMDKGSLGLIVDIGGGTSDFSIFERQAAATNIITSHGVRIGGTDFDRALSLNHVMPLLGRGCDLRNEMGPGQNEAPKAIFNDLATWEKIAFLYTPETRRLAARFAKLGVDPVPFRRLHDVLDLELGHDIAFAVETGKIAVNGPDANAAIKLDFVEKNLAPPLTDVDLARALQGHTDNIATAAAETLAQADLTPEKIGTIVFVGGSSLMHTVTNAMTEMFPHAKQERTQAFTAVADGLAIAAQQA